MKDKSATEKRAYSAIAKSLREFGYPDVTDEMVKETHEAILKKPSLAGSKEVKDFPHGIVSMFASSQLRELWEAKAIRAPEKS